MSDDFFGKIDGKLGELRGEKGAKEEAAQANLAFLKVLIPRLVEIAEDYASKCKERGISASVKPGEYSLSFTLRYPQGQETDLVGAPDRDMQNKLSFETFYPDDNGKRYKSLATDWYGESDWSDDMYKRRLEKLIEDFVYYADRHGGL